MIPLDEMDGGDSSSPDVLLATVYCQCSVPVVLEIASRCAPLAKMSVLSIVHSGCALTGAGAREENNTLPVSAFSAKMKPCSFEMNTLPLARTGVWVALYCKSYVHSVCFVSVFTHMNAASVVGKYIKLPSTSTDTVDVTL
jgi:hypothetical protein